jgi:glycolate oxidase FAD binding subunit
MPEAALAQLQERVRSAAAAGQPLRIRGGGTKDFYGQALVGDVLDTRALSGIVSYAPTELVVTARMGTPLAEIEDALAGQAQMLAFEPPRHGAQSTLGGVVAAGFSGPRRAYAGAVRDFVLGAKVVDGRGEALAFGGQVIKNVAGFDVSRLMTGAMGTLGVLTEVSLKCLPRPKREMTRILDCDGKESIRLVNTWGAMPLPISATCHHANRLWVRLSGAPVAVVGAGRVIGGSEVDPGTFWAGLRDQALEFFDPARDQGAPLWRISVASSAPWNDFAGTMLVEWGGALRWLAPRAPVDAPMLRRWAATHGGHATLYRSADKSAGAFHPLTPALLALHQRLKAVFDPQSILNRGRLYREF